VRQLATALPQASLLAVQGTLCLVGTGREQVRGMKATQPVIPIPQARERNLLLFLNAKADSSSVAAATSSPETT